MKSDSRAQQNVITREISKSETKEKLQMSYSKLSPCKDIFNSLRAGYYCDLFKKKNQYHLICQIINVSMQPMSKLRTCLQKKFYYENS